MLDLLQQSNAPLTATAVAEELGLHPNSARHHLGQLVAAGFATRAPLPTNTTGRPNVGFSPSREAPPVRDQYLIELTTMLLEHFCADDERARRAGRSWSERLGEDPTMDDILQAMADAGFAPKFDDDTLTFQRCPFQGTFPPNLLGAVCQVHVGFLQGALPDRQLGDLHVGRVCTVEIGPPPANGDGEPQVVRPSTTSPRG